MWKILFFLGALTGFDAQAAGAGAERAPRAESRRSNAEAREQERLRALSRRGLLGNYQRLLGADTVPTATQGRSIGLTAEQARAASRMASLDLAAFGFTVADVAAYRRRKIDLFDVAYRLFQGRTTPGEQMILADTVVIAIAGKPVEDRARTDGFLSATPYSVIRSLKGSRAVGDVVHAPRKSGPKPGGTYLTVSSDIEVEPGKKYLLVASRNWYEQIVAEEGKQAQDGSAVAPYLVYEMADDGALRPYPRPTLSGEAPKDIGTVEDELRKSRVADARRASARED